MNFLKLILFVGFLGAIVCKDHENDSNLESAVAVLARSVAELEHTVGRLQSDNAELKQRSRKIQSENVELKQRLDKLENQSSTSSVDNLVAFCAVIDEADSNEYNEGEIIRYRLVKTNYGNHFDPDTFIFTVPVRGLYMFYTNQLTDYDSAGSLGLFRTSGGTEYLETRSWSRTEINVMSNMVILECQQGDTVYVKQWYAGTTRLHILYGGIYNTFNGHLISILP